jgi:DNA-directed RNA polymerase specialized sigma24 family protein
MGRLLNFFLGKGRRHNCAAYPHAAALFDGLQQEENEAIQCVYARISGTVVKMGKAYGLMEEDTEELIGDCIALLLLKIRTGQYIFLGHDPATYAIEIAKNKVRHFKKRNTIDLSELPELPVEPEYTSLESVEILEKLLSRLSENCQKLIRLKYLDEIRDKDIIEQQLTQYTTVDALKNHRAQCMKKLMALGAKH